ncbi:flagellar hook-length control protein FliK [Roseovarius amoyensis]|uniref:flagellar hook-length control protein FliK n=1 Tax=Roseovarius amoyensis TaxID=2211448 RepID=UPI000DBE2795|nr:flagellar hook-length control protein FliK [Roseovarius amoyensis]
MIIHSNGPDAAPANGAGTAPVDDVGPETGARIGDALPAHGFADVFAGLMRGALSPESKEADTDATAETPGVETPEDTEDATEIAGNVAVPPPELAGSVQRSMPAALDSASETPAPTVWGHNQHPAAGVEMGAPGKKDRQGARATAQTNPGLVVDGRARGDSNGLNRTDSAPQSAMAEGRPMALQGGPTSAGPVPPIQAAAIHTGQNAGNIPDTTSGASVLAEATRHTQASPTPADPATAVTRAGPQERPVMQPTESAWVTEGAQDMSEPAPAPPAPAVGNPAANRAVLASSPAVTPENPAQAAFDPVGADALQAADVARADRPGAAPVTGQTAHGAPNPPARAITPQIAAAVQASGDRSVEIVLSPVELGKVRITLSPGEAGMAVNILADRPETLDLLRRHADLLAQDFRELGYGGTEFSFGSDSRSTGQERGAVPGAAAAQGDSGLPVTAQDDTPRQLAGRLAPDGRMDIRL